MEVILGGHPTIIVNIYAPTNKEARERLFNQLATLRVSASVLVLVGGDFNCCLYPATDRSNQLTATTHGSNASFLSGGWLTR